MTIIKTLSVLKVQSGKYFSSLSDLNRIHKVLLKQFSVLFLWKFKEFFWFCILRSSVYRLIFYSFQFCMWGFLQLLKWMHSRNHRLICEFEILFSPRANVLICLYIPNIYLNILSIDIVQISYKYDIYTVYIYTVHLHSVASVVVCVDDISIRLCIPFDRLIICEHKIYTVNT